MPNALERKDNGAKIAAPRLAAINRLLIEGMKIGPASKRRAVNKVLREFPEFTRGDCWRRIRHLRKTPELADLQAHQPRNGPPRSRKTSSERRTAPRRWTTEDDDTLVDLAGYELVNKIAQRLCRPVGAVRYRLCALGMSAKVTDGWSLRGLRKMLRVSPTRLRQFIGSGMLGVRDDNVTAQSLAAFCDRHRVAFDQPVMERIAKALTKKCDAYTWKRVADLLGVPIAQVQDWICAGLLKVVDPFVTERSFQEFCKNYGNEINLALIDPATAKWLIEEYRVPAPVANNRAVGRARKHALVVRTCRCGRKIAGNVYFKHVKSCRVLADEATRRAVCA